MNRHRVLFFSIIKKHVSIIIIVENIIKFYVKQRILNDYFIGGEVLFDGTGYKVRKDN